MKRALHIALLIVLLGLVLLFPAFVAKERSQRTCTDLRVAYMDKTSFGLLTHEEVRGYLSNHFSELVGRPWDAIPTDRIEEALRDNPYIAEAEAYGDINGMLFVEYREEEPMLRLFPRGSHSVYMSQRGRILPLKSGFSQRLPIVSGELGTIPQPGNLLTPETHPLLHGLLAFGLLLGSDEFCRNLIDQIHVDHRGELTLIPRLGQQQIAMGTLDDFPEKMENLKLFYLAGMPLGTWDRYSSISLKFKNQVVCTKRQ